MPVCYREVAWPIAEMLQPLLTIERNGVVHLAFDAARLAIAHQLVAALREDLVGHEAVPYARVARREAHLLDRFQRLVVERGVLVALRDDAFRVTDYMERNSCLDGVEAAVHT